jgi:hypothetical protein
MAGPLFGVPGLIQGLGSLGASLIGNSGAKRRQNLANKQNIEFWNMQNKYNTPKAQMGRLKDAGLNPNLIYGSGSANTGVAGSIAPSKAAPYNIQNPIPLQSALLQSQIDLNNSNANKNNVQADSVGGLLPGRKAELRFKNELSAIKNDIASQTKSASINIIKQSSLSANFNTIVKEKESEEALKGNMKGNYIGTILNNLGLDSRNRTDAKIIQGLMYGLIGTQVFNQMSQGVKNLIQARVGKKVPTFTRNIENQQIFNK